MNIQEVRAAINDFRKAFRDDLGSPVAYGKRTFAPYSGGFSIDERDVELNWFLETSKNIKLYGTSTLASEEDLRDAGLNTNCTGIVTCIYEDILDLQPVDETTGTKLFIRENLLDDKLRVILNGAEIEFNIIDYTFAFQLRDTYIFIKFGVSSDLEV